MKSHVAPDPAPFLMIVLFSKRVPFNLFIVHNCILMLLVSRLRRRQKLTDILKILMMFLFDFLDINDCAGNPCQHGGTCIDQINRFRCKCAPGWEGIRCQISE